MWDQKKSGKSAIWPDRSLFGEAKNFIRSFDLLLVVRHIKSFSTSAMVQLDIIFHWPCAHNWSVWVSWWGNISTVKEAKISESLIELYFGAILDLDRGDCRVDFLDLVCKLRNSITIGGVSSTSVLRALLRLHGVDHEVSVREFRVAVTLLDDDQLCVKIFHLPAVRPVFDTCATFKRSST